MLLDRLDFSAGGASAGQAAGAVVRILAGRLVTFPESAINESRNERTIMKKISKRREDTEKKYLDAEENQNIIEMLRGKVREKLKNVQINQGENSLTHLLIDDKISQWPKLPEPSKPKPKNVMNQTDSWCSLLTTKTIISVYHITQKFFFHLEAEKSISTLNTASPLFNPQTEVSFDEGLWFFMPRGDKGSDSGRCSEQRSVNDSYPKHFSLDDNLQNFAEDQGEDFMQEVIFPDLLEVKAAEYEVDQEQIRKQQANIFVPSNSPVQYQFRILDFRVISRFCYEVAKERKLPKDMMPRILEDEGFYIQRKPEIHKKTCNKMENRLLTIEEGKSWFEESGEIMSLPSPIRQSWNFRLNTSKGSLNPALKTIYRKAVKPDLESSMRNKMEGQREMYQLDLNIVGLQFSHHPLFNQEQVLCARLLQLYECFQDRQQQNLPQLLYEKLIALRDATKLASENLEISQLTKKSLQDYYWQIRVKMNKCDEQNQEELLEMSETQKKTEGRAFKNGDKWESLSYLASELEETDIERIRPITLMPQLSFTTELTNLSKCSLVYEVSQRTSLLAKLYLPLPNSTEVKSKTVLEYVEFSSDELVTPAYGEVGSICLKTALGSTDVPFILEGNATEELCLLTSGKLSYCLSWALDENGIPLTPKSQSLRSAYCSVLRNVDARGVPGIPWLINARKLFEWANEVKIDPNNPEYSDLMEFVMYMKHKGQDIPKYFRLEQMQDEFNFVSEEEMEKSKRFQLLQLRNAGQLDVFLLQQMPLYDKEIPDLVFQEYETQIEKDIPISDVNSITAQRINSANFLKKMKKLIMRRIVKVSKVNLSDVVADYEEIVSASQLTYAVCKLVERQRKLKPQRKERRKVAAQTICDGDIKILVRILRAYNIPTRNTTVNRHKETVKSVSSDEILNEAIQSSKGTIYPFVEVSFQHTVYRTSTASGSHPCWNEEIKVDFISPGHDYSFSSLSKIKDNIYINIFDEMIIEKQFTNHFSDPYCKSCSSYSHIRKNWLGSIVFPFSALLQQSEISGTFQVNTPPVLLGYTWSKTHASPKEDYNGQNFKESTFLNIFATIEPQISYVTCNPELDKFSDQTDVFKRAQIFKKSCQAMFPNRRVTATVFNGEGIQILVTRYIKALNPPQQLLDIFLHDSNATLDLIARFVSLIPVVPDVLDENDGFDIWMTSERCISLAIGNKEEHAILLCNFFLYFGKKALVVLGTSMLEGQVAYVLTQETDEYLLWNPLTGQCHKQFDPFCPLQSVDCLFDDGNVWFNIQQNNTPMAVHFDYSKESFWKQLLPKDFQGTNAQSIQYVPEEIIYCETNKSMIEDLKNRIERTLKCKMMEWRPKQPTRWNRQCTYILQKILPKLELGTGSFVLSEEEGEFERLLQFYWVTGFPMQMPYTDVQSIIDAVYQTGIHSSEFPQTEFALAVYIHPYPNNVLSVWVYLASLARHE
ncbi:protein CC2D2B isoform X1 [Prionailurus iriomotensis]